MNISDYRNKLLAEINESAKPLNEQTQALMTLAGDAKRIDRLIDVIGDENRPAEEKIVAIDALNKVSVFSPVLPAKMPDYVNALRGQMEAEEKELRLRVFSTLTSIKDEIAQSKLLGDLASEKRENEKLLPTSTAISMLGRDQKALPAPLLRKIAANPPTEAALVEAVRHMAGDVDSFALLKRIMEDEKSPLEARAMIPEMINKVDPETFLNSAKTMLEKKGATAPLAAALTRGVAEVKQLEGKVEFTQAKEAVRNLMKTSPQSFKNLANELLFKKEDGSEK